MRLRIDLSYDGTEFHGWAEQPGLRTVQGVLTMGLQTVLRVPELLVQCAGRTDSGVHARSQVAHVDVEDEVLAAIVRRRAEVPQETLLRKLNGILPFDLRIHRLREAGPGFDARFSALWRRYAYRIADSPEVNDPLMRHHVLRWRRALDLGAMNVASSEMLGLHDFASYCRPREGATTIRTIQRFTWDRDENGVAVGTVVADAFCHSMVRSLVGTMIAVGEHRVDPSWAAELRDRRERAGRRGEPTPVVAPAVGLTLEEVAYPPDEELSARNLVTMARREASAGSTEPTENDDE